MSVLHRRFQNLRGLTLSFSVWCAAVLTAADNAPYRIGKFPQEIAERYTTSHGLPSNDVVRLEVDESARVVAITTEGNAVFVEGRWIAETPRKGHEPRYVDVIRRGDALILAGSDGLLVRDGNGKERRLHDGDVRQVAVQSNGKLVVASEEGLFVETATNELERWLVADGMGRHWARYDVRGVAVDADGGVWFATLAGAGVSSDGDWRFYTGKEGLPYNDFSRLAATPGGGVWFGTRIGAVQFDGREWKYRQGKRWLPHDDVRDVRVAADGSVWFATAGGVGRIRYRSMTLAEKAEFYEAEIEKYIRRTPFGYLSEVGLSAVGDKSSKIIYHDSDNDGLWTSMYGAGECFAYAATRSPAAKDRAQRAFEALRFLQKVTQGCEHSPPKGYVARTIRSVDLPDPNVGRVERDRLHQAHRDKLWKVYEPRWPKSADGKWYWKSDTSSDELDGHYFFYPAYYDLVAESEAEKERVREVVRDLTDHLIEYGFTMVDHDGRPTRWAIYGPRSLNHDPMWRVERGLKSLSILSYLAVAEHMTGDAKYGDAARQLRERYAYDTNAMVSKIQMGIGSGNQSDDEMAFMCFYNLIKYSKDDALREQILYSFYTNYALVQPEMNPFFNFAYAAAGLGATYSDPWGEHSINPWEGWLEDSMKTLTGFPLDRIDWSHRNSHRLDIVFLPRQQAVELTDEMQPGRRGYLVNGRVLPIENRHFNHWNSDPWRLDTGGGGRGLASGTVFLLPYYMGLYHKFIAETES